MRVYLAILKREGKIQNFARYSFGHGASYLFDGDSPKLFASYHPSQQNTFTGKLTETMLEDVLLKIRDFLESRNPGEAAERKRTG